MHRFIHCIDLDNPFTCCNIIETEQLWSYKALLHTNMFQATDITTISIADMYDRFHKIGIGPCSPRGILLLQGSMIRSGMQLGFGMNKPRMLNTKHYSKIVEASETEIRFEEVRRKVAPFAPSRLSGIFIAEDSFESRLHLADMLAYIGRPYIVNIDFKSCLNLFRADSHFFEEFVKTREDSMIEKYWLGEKFDTDDSCSWEYLFDGILEIKDEIQLEYIRSFGKLDAPEIE